MLSWGPFSPRSVEGTYGECYQLLNPHRTQGQSKSPPQMPTKPKTETQQLQSLYARKPEIKIYEGPKY